MNTFVLSSGVDRSGNDDGIEQDVSQDESDFYSENGSAEKDSPENAQSSSLVSKYQGSVKPVVSISRRLDDLEGNSPSNDYHAIPGLGDSSPDLPPDAAGETAAPPDDSSGEDLYGEDGQPDQPVSVNSSKTAHAVEQDLGFTPEPEDSRETSKLAAIHQTRQLHAITAQPDNLLDTVQKTQQSGVACLPDAAKATVKLALDQSCQSEGATNTHGSDVVLPDTNSGHGNLEVAGKTAADLDSQAHTNPDGSNDVAEWRFDSSDVQSISDKPDGAADGQSDSNSHDSDDDDGDDDSDDDAVLLNPEQQAQILMQESADADEPASTAGPLRSANEQTEKYAEKPNIIVTADMAIVELGFVAQIVDNVAVIQANTSGEYRVLEAGSVLCLADRTVIGSISETLGRVQEPRYTIGFPSAQDLEESKVQKDTKIYYVQAHSCFVFTQPLRLAKGTDASNVHDEELSHDELEFSDDQAEAEHKKAVKQAKKEAREPKLSVGAANESSNSQDVPTPRDGFLSQPPKGPKNPNRGRGNARAQPAAHQAGRKLHPDTDFSVANSAMISYDDDDEDEDMYRPLKRPDNLHEMMSAGPPPIQSTARGRAESKPGFGNRGGRHDRGGRGAAPRDRGRGGFNARGATEKNPKHWKEQHNESDVKPTKGSNSHGQPPMPFQAQHNAHSNLQPYAQQNASSKRKFTAAAGSGSESSSPAAPKHAKARHQPDAHSYRSAYTSPHFQSPSQIDHQPPQRFVPPQTMTSDYSYPQPQSQSHLHNQPPYNGYQIQSPSPIPNLPAGSHVNPAFLLLQQYAQAHNQTGSSTLSVPVPVPVPVPAPAPAPVPVPVPVPVPLPPPQPAVTNGLAGMNIQQLQQLAALLQGQRQVPALPVSLPISIQPTSSHQMQTWPTHGTPHGPQHAAYQAPLPQSSSDEMDTRASQDRLQAIINSYRATDPRR